VVDTVCRHAGRYVAVTGIELNLYRRAFTLCPVLLIAACLSGCRDNEKSESPPLLATPRQPLEIPLVEKPAPAAQAPAQPAPPLRRALSDFPDAYAPMLALNEPPAIVFRVVQDAGQTNLRAKFVSGSSEQNRAITDELKALGFIEGAAQTWSRQFYPADHSALEQSIWTRLAEATRLARELGQAASQARHPIFMAAADRRLLYTGHPLDVALRDPELYFRVRLNVDAASNQDEAGNYEGYARGGQIFVNPAGRLRLERFALSGITNAVPADTERIAIKPTGSVVAFSADGKTTELGHLEVFRVFKPLADHERRFVTPATEATAPERVTLDNSNGPLLVGHLELARIDMEAASHALAARRVLETLLTTLAQPAPSTPAPASGNSASPATLSTLTLHADLPWTEKHLQALGITVERTPGLTTIAAKDTAATVTALTKVLQVLRLRMSTHEQNIRNAERVRDADNRINPYRRKMIEIGPQGEAVEKADPSPLPKISKPGDPNADADGFITMPNVNKAVETSEFQAAADEYRLVRTALERLAPQHIFPDPIPLPQVTKPEAP